MFIKKILLLLMVFTYNFSLFDKGFNLNKLFNIINNQKHFLIIGQNKMPWEENYLILKPIAKNILNNINSCQNPELVFVGSILKFIEDIMIFQTVKNTKPTEFKSFSEALFFKYNPLSNSVKKTIKYLPFFIAITNELSTDDNNFFIIKYFFSNIYVKNPKEQKIVVIDVANDVIEKMELLDSLFNSKEKLLFLRDMNQKHIFFGQDMSFFLSILGAPLHSNVFSNGQTVLFYGDCNKCIHNFNQQVGFALYFNKNLYFKDIVISHQNICISCVNYKNVPIPFDRNRYLKMKLALANVTNTTNLKEFFFEGAYKNVNNIYFNISDFKNFYKNISFNQSIQLTKYIINKYHLTNSLKYYEELLIQLFNNKFFITITEFFTIFETEDFVINELIPKEKPIIVDQKKEI